MTVTSIPSDADRSAEACRERSKPFDSDFGSALMEAPSDTVTAPPESRSGTAEREAPVIDSEFVAMLLDGLSDTPPAASEETDQPHPRHEGEFASAPGDPNPAPAESPAMTEFEQGPRADLSKTRAISPEDADIDVPNTATRQRFDPSSLNSNDPLPRDPFAAALPADETPQENEFPSPESVEPAEPIDDDLKSALLAGLADAYRTAPQGPDGPGAQDVSRSAEPPPDEDDETPEADSDPVFDLEQTLLEGLPDGSSVSFDEQDAPALPESTAAVPEGSPAATGAEDLLAADDFASELLEGLSNGPGVSSGDPEPPDLLTAPESVDASFDSLSVEPSPSPDDRADPVLDSASDNGLHGDADHGPAAALAFATDPETERALREGLMRYGGPSSGLDEPQVWPGGIQAAISALAAGHTSGLVIVDLDGVPFPVGVIHELAEVCDAGTAVIALGSENTARVSREVLLAGVSDYLVKPVTAETVRQAALRATGADEGPAALGCVAGFAGTGGSGATTLAAATALHAAGEGRYVSVLDLNRAVSAMGLLLDVEPAAGLDQLFDVADRSSPDLKLLDGVRTERSERISVYAYRLGASPPPVPSMRALDWLLDRLRRRSQLVIVDGLDDSEARFDLPGALDVRVLAVEPTPAGCLRAARTIGLLGASAPILMAQNHTRKFGPDEGARLLTEAGVEAPPDAVIPFDASLPELASRGWPGERLPRGLRKPVAALAERIFARAFESPSAAYAEAA